MYQESEVVDLILVVFLTPLLWVGLRSVTVAGKRWFVASYLSVVFAYVFTVAEGYVAEEFFNSLEHGFYALSGVCLVIAVRAFVREATSSLSEL